jgi:hypothetical protein
MVELGLESPGSTLLRTVCVVDCSVCAEVGEERSAVNPRHIGHKGEDCQVEVFVCPACDA